VQDWSSTHFDPAVRQYYNSNNLAFKALLVLGNVPGHSHSPDDLHPETDVVVMPPNTSCDIQSVDQTIINFKWYYKR
jgi:hypothetical protein